MQLIFFVMVIFTGGCGIAFVVDGYGHRQWALKNKPEGYIYPGFQELWITAVSGVVFYLIESSVSPIFL